ncbi:hypothetical protein KIPB_011360 [Kipferlia bialata]|uniref:Uncharacterized protein n=1 Tax=Kipferlia bialata TaxID=797122 RepID=A0A9K3GNA2_9EUKA|nr:hypothetical protein KIPB_011360 [Kipferlia bialata]|eukprot:g11360.t1
MPSSLNPLQSLDILRSDHTLGHSRIAMEGDDNGMLCDTTPEHERAMELMTEYEAASSSDEYMSPGDLSIINNRRKRLFTYISTHLTERDLFRMRDAGLGTDLDNLLSINLEIISELDPGTLSNTLSMVEMIMRRQLQIVEDVYGCREALPCSGLVFSFEGKLILFTDH